MATTTKIAAPAPTVNGKQAFSTNIDALKKTFLTVIQVANSLISHQTKGSGNINQLGLRLEEFNAVCDELYVQISNAKNQLLFEDILGSENETLLTSVVGDIEKQLMERTEILDALVNRIRSASELQNELSTLQPFPIEEDDIIFTTE